MKIKNVFAAVVLFLALITGCTKVDPLIGNTTGGNHAPSISDSPTPGNLDSNKVLTSILRWTGGDKDGDTVWYYLYFGTDSSTMQLLDTLKDLGQADTVLPDLDYATRYFWQVIATDGKEVVNGPVWNFKTKNAPMVVAGWTLYDIGNSDIPDDNITALALDNSNVMWLGTRYTGLVSLAGANTWTSYSGLPAYAISTICIDNTNKKWIGTWGGGLVRFGTIVDTVYTNDVFSSDLPDNIISSLSISGSGDTLMVGGYNGRTSILLTPDSVRLVSFSSESLWVVNNVIANYPIHEYPVSGSERRDTVKHNLDTAAVFTAKNILIANLQLIYQSPLKNWKSFTIDSIKLYNNSIANYPIETVYPLPVGWVSADTAMRKADSAQHRDDSISRYDYFRNGLATLRFKYNSFNEYPKWVSMRDQSNKLWLASLNGIQIDGTYFKKGTFSLTDTFGVLVIADSLVTAAYRQVSGDLPSNHITCMVDDGSKQWIGTPVGLAVFNGLTWNTYTTANSGLPSNRIQALAVGSDNKIWIGTDAGLVVFDNQ